MKFWRWITRRSVERCANCGHEKARHQNLGFMWVCWYGGSDGCECTQPAKETETVTPPAWLQLPKPEFETIAEAQAYDRANLGLPPKK